MATYTREGRFTPVNINSDPSATLAYNQQRLALQAKGTAIVESQYQKLLDLELTHGDNQEKLNSFFKKRIFFDLFRSSPHDEEDGADTTDNT